MPYLFCQKHGPDRTTPTMDHLNELRAEGECVLVVEGTLNSGPWLCDSCNAQLNISDRAWLKSAFPSYCYEQLADYDFSYELGYFAMTPNDRVTSYGTPWPDDSLQPDRIAAMLTEERPSKRRAMSATELFAKTKA